MTSPSYMLAMGLMTQRAFEWSSSLDSMDYEDALWEWQFRQYVNARRRRLGLKPLNNPKPKPGQDIYRGDAPNPET